MTTEKPDTPDAAPGVDPKLLEILVCPLTRTRLTYNAASQELLSRAAGLAYPIRNGVPLMIEDVARKLSEQEIAALRG